MKTFVKNSLMTFLSRIATAVFTVIITVVVARSLGPNGQGIYSVATLFPSLLLVFLGFGMNTGVVFFMGKEKYPRSQIFGTTIFSNFLISIVAVSAGFFIIFFTADKFFPGIEKIYLFLSLSLVPLLLFFNLGCQILLGAHEFKKYNLISIFQSGLFLVLTLILLLALNFGVTVTILSQIFSYAVAIILLWLVAKKITKGIDFKPNFNYLKESLVYGFKIHLTGIFDFLHSRIDLFFINLFLNPAFAGIYFAAVRLAEGVWLFSSSTSTVLFPRVAAEKDSQNLKDFTPLVCRNVLFVTFFMIILLFLISGWLINFLYSAEFLGAILPFRILLLGSFVITGWHILVNDLAARGKPMLNTYSIGISALLNIILNIFLIPAFGITGAAFATVISYFVMFFISLFFYAKESQNKIFDIIFVKKEDFIFYKDLLLAIKTKVIK
jgi:O-antigen/teichoic acid export membrane protein